jgi:hypothetical protein
MLDAVTQCVFVLSTGCLGIVKAEGRPPGAQGRVFHLRPDDGQVVLEAAGPSYVATRQPVR